MKKTWMTEPALHRADAQVYAREAETLIHARGNYAHVHVRPSRNHLVVELEGGERREPVARLTYLGERRFGLSFHRHTGRWEPMPFSGPLEAATSELVQMLGPYLVPLDFPLDISGTGH
jgi:hypothetical protein